MTYVHTDIYKQTTCFENSISLEQCFNDMDLCGSAQDKSWKLHFIPLSSRSVVDFFTILGPGSREIIPMMRNVYRLLRRQRTTCLAKLMEWICECLVASESLLLLLTRLKYEFDEALSYSGRISYFMCDKETLLCSPRSEEISISFYFHIKYRFSFS